MNTSQYLNYFSICVFGGSIILILYLVYYEWKQARIDAEQDEIEMGEMKNEGIIDSLSDAELTDSINKDVGGPSGNPPKKSS